MALKILAGYFKGFLLNTRENSAMRPTTVQMRRKIFDAHQFFNDVIVCDICAGTGAIGFEAISRGAHTVLFVEKQGQQVSQIKKNLHYMQERLTRMNHRPDFTMPQTEVLKCDVLHPRTKKVLHQYFSSRDICDKKIIFFIDPPYAKVPVYQSILNWFSQDHCLPWSELWIEADQHVISSDDREFRAKLALPHEAEYSRCYKHGDHFVIIYKNMFKR